MLVFLLLFVSLSYMLRYIYNVTIFEIQNWTIEEGTLVENENEFQKSSYAKLSCSTKISLRIAIAEQCEDYP